MYAQPARRARTSTAAVLGLVSVGLWAFTFSWMWIPYYFFHIDGQLYALYPLAILTEVFVLALAIVAAVFAIVGAARRRTRALQVVFVLLGSALMLTIGPVLLWFGTIPIGADLFG
jgi:uncharacterized membrane protein